MKHHLRVWLRLLRPDFMRQNGEQADWRVPELEAQITVTGLDHGNLATYRALCGYSGVVDAANCKVPPAYLQHLAGRSHLELLSDPGFPVSPLGLIHVRNDITEFRSISARDFPLTLRSRLTDAGLHPRGRLIQIETRACHSGSPAETQDVWVSTLHALIPQKRGGSVRPKRGDHPGLASPSGSALEINPSPEWDLNADLGRRFSFLMGDYNPIHLWPWSAKLFGFERPIIHGMWTLARVLATLENELPIFPRRTVVEFKSPIQLPGRANLKATKVADGTIHFEVRTEDSKRPAVTGNVARWPEVSSTEGGPPFGRAHYL